MPVRRKGESDDANDSNHDANSPCQYTTETHKTTDLQSIGLVYALYQAMKYVQNSCVSSALLTVDCKEEKSRHGSEIYSARIDGTNKSKHLLSTPPRSQPAGSRSGSCVRLK